MTRSVAQAVGLGGTVQAINWLKSNRIGKTVDRKFKCYRLGDLEGVILGMQESLPDPKSKLSDFMFVVPRFYFRADCGTQEHTLTFVSDQNVSDFLGARGQSIFDRLGILDAEDKPFRINTHAMRHFLNTLAQEGLLSQLDIARWSGRKDVGQNAAYDHTGGVQLGREMRRVIETDGMEGPIVDTIESLPPADRDAFLKGRFATAHFTSIGACVQDFSLAPCPSHGSCAGCTEHLVVKGKPDHKAEAERLLMEHQAMLDAARTEMADGIYGASVWVEHNEKVVAGLAKTIAVHDDTTIADGTMVQI